MLQNVVNNGTGSAIRYHYGLTEDIAGKTGTSQNHADGWFIGFTPDLVAGAWVGGELPGIASGLSAMGKAPLRRCPSSPDS